MSKWQEITESIYQDIAAHNGEPGSMAAMAKRTGVTVSAVGIGIRNLKKQGVLEIAEQGNWKKPNTYRIHERRSAREIEEAEIDRLTLEGEL